MPEVHPRKAERSVTLLKNLFLPAAVIGLSTVALVTGQFRTIVARVACDFATALIEIEPRAPASTANAPDGVWNCEFE
jgi:hypothetical protein